MCHSTNVKQGVISLLIMRVVMIQFSYQQVLLCGRAWSTAQAILS